MNCCRFVAVLTWCALLSAGACAEDGAVAPAQIAEQATDREPLPESPQEREKKRTALAGLAAVAAIAIIGVALGAVIILWAGRLRRLNRQPLPTARLQDELWFLRPAKPPVSDEGPERTSTDASGPT